MIQRFIEQEIQSLLFKKKAIIVLGPRQTGKTTLLNKICTSIDKPLVLLCDDPEVRSMLENRGELQLRHLVGDHKLVFIDEAQRVRNIGLTLKIITDRMSDIQLLVSGSSALGLNDSIQESLTGRKREFFLYPVSMIEFVSHFGYIEAKGQLNQRVVYGMYPDVINHYGKEKDMLFELAGSYLYKDILSYEGIRKPALLEKLLRALALQIGSEVSYSELSRLLEVDKKTIANYIDLLEKSFVVFQLQSFSRNQRKEIRNGRKIFFYDTGIRNAVISDFRDIENRSDAGALWENFVIAEMIKKDQIRKWYSNHFFWRTILRSEIDFIQERDGQINAYEIKLHKRKKSKPPISFQDAYPQNNFSLIDRDNFFDIILAE